MKDKLWTNFLVKSFLVLKTRLFFRPQVISFSEVLNNAKRVLIFLPTKVESFPIALNHLNSFNSFFSGSQKFLLLPFDGEGFSSNLFKFEIISLKKSYLNWFSLPNKRFVKKLRALKFDITLDMDLERSFFNAYLSFLSGSRLRIGVKGGWGLPFYNLEISLSKDGKYLDELYDSFVNTLKRLKSLSNK